MVQHQKKSKTLRKLTKKEADALLLEKAIASLGEEFKAPKSKKIDPKKPLHSKFHIRKSNQQPYKQQIRGSGQYDKTTAALKTLFWHIGATPKDIICAVVPKKIRTDYIMHCMPKAEKL